MALVTPGLPPLQAKIGLLSEPSNSTSWVRPLRIGPTGSGAWLWNTAANRVRCSTFSSNTMSAWLRPLCGRASGWLSILTTSADRAASAGSSIGRPVSGITGSAGIVVESWSTRRSNVVDDDDDVVLASVVGASVVGVVAAAVVADAASPPLLHAASASAAIMNVAIVWWISQVSQRSRCALRAGGGTEHCVQNV